MARVARCLIVLACGCGSLVLSGCGSCRDVSGDPESLGSMHVGGRYELRRDVFLYDVNTDRLPFDRLSCQPGYWLYPEGDRSYGTPLPTVQEYRRTRQPRAVRGVVAAGTQLSLTRILFHDFVTGAKLHYVFTIRDGTARGTKVAGDALMTHDTGHTAGVPNESYLQAVP